MPKQLTRPQAFALKGYTIKIVRGKFIERDRFFVSPTVHNRWSGPYKTLQRATAAIAQKLSREFVERDERLQQAKEQLHG